ncbi:MAG TPA: hypothetical protein VHJ18_09230 [Streptosporangiaceae bacterium]|nr:hypothetical protein [Streptosporangiaceae bacterium]
MEGSNGTQLAGDERRRRRKPATGFPVIDLGEAASVIARASQHGWEHTVAEIAGYMGHGTTNSGAFRAKLAGLRDYGLLSGRGESLEITPVGRRIAVPETDEERLAALQEAFANTAFGPLYQESVKGSPISVDSIGRRAVNRLGVAPGSQAQFGEVFARSAAAAGLAETAADGKITLATKPQARPSDGENPGLADRPPGDSPPVPGQSGRSAFKPVLDQHWPFPDGEVALIVTIARPLSASDFAAIGSVVAQIEKLVAGLTGGENNA